MFSLSQSTIDVAASFAANLQLLGFTSFFGNFARSFSTQVQRATSAGDDPLAFTKLIALHLTGDPTTNLDLTSATLANGQTGQTIRPKGFILYCEWPDQGTGAEITLSAGLSDGYTGAYRLDTNVYSVYPSSPLLTLIGKRGDAPTPANKVLRVSKGSGSNPSSTYLMIWGD